MTKSRARKTGSRARKTGSRVRKTRSRARKTGGHWWYDDEDHLDDLITGVGRKYAPSRFPTNEQLESITNGERTVFDGKKGTKWVARIENFGKQGIRRYWQPVMEKKKTLIF